MHQRSYDQSDALHGGESAQQYAGEDSQAHGAGIQGSAGQDGKRVSSLTPVGMYGEGHEDEYGDELGNVEDQNDGLNALVSDTINQLNVQNLQWVIGFNKDID